jgi:hypothetical protein
VNVEQCFAGDPASTEKRHAVTKWLTGRESLKDLDDATAWALFRWLNAQPVPDGSGEWQPDNLAVREAQAIYTEAQKAAGQMAFI